MGSVVEIVRVDFLINRFVRILFDWINRIFWAEISHGAVHAQRDDFCKFLKSHEKFQNIRNNFEISGLTQKFIYIYIYIYYVL